MPGAGVDSVCGDQFDPGLPALAGLCRVYGYLYDIQGNPETGAVVRAYLPAGVVRYQNVIVSPFSVSVSSDTVGYFYLDLLPSDSLIPTGREYEISISRSDGTVLRRRLAVPAMSSWQLVW